MFIILVTRKNIGWSEWICLDRQNKWVKSLRDRMQITEGQKTQETSITHTTHCGLVVACSLITMLAFSNKQNILTKTGIRAVYCTLYTAVIYALLQQNNCQCLPQAWTQEKMFIHFQRERALPRPGCSMFTGWMSITAIWWQPRILNLSASHKQKICRNFSTIAYVFF